MRLINTRTLELEEFADETTIYGKYAILSHVWKHGEEVSFQELQHGRGKDKSGYTKILRTCQMALEQNKLDFAWIDTCCIDKSSSAELSEAINSMYRWYFKAKVCYVYLADVPSVSFEHSRWFDRGWTLQELIAPANIRFYDGDWRHLGHKFDLLANIHAATGINVEVLKERSQLTTISVAARMSWAAHRKTTREEDRAYSLMGIFDVNMPMLYGEGNKAFTRLQHEIMRQSADHSILAWTPSIYLLGEPLLSDSPYAFRNASATTSWSNSGVDESFVLTNKGLRITLPVATEGKYLLAMLNCRDSKDVSKAMALRLAEITVEQPHEALVPPREAATTVCRLAFDVREPCYGSSTAVVDVDWKKHIQESRWMDLLILDKPRLVREDDRDHFGWFNQSIIFENMVAQLVVVDKWPKWKWIDDCFLLREAVRNGYGKGAYLVFRERLGSREFLLAVHDWYGLASAEPHLRLEELSTTINGPEDVFIDVDNEKPQRSASIEFQTDRSKLVATARRSGVRHRLTSGIKAWTVTIYLE